MELVIASNGDVCCLYDEAIELRSIGRLSIERVSHLEPMNGGDWLADLSLCGGPILGPFPSRTQALESERRWLQHHLRGFSC
jgi:hypothetical protein